MSVSPPVFGSIRNFDDVRKALENIRNYFLNALPTPDQINGAISHKNTEDRLKGLVVVDGGGKYTGGNLVSGETGNTVNTTKSIHVKIAGQNVRIAVLDEP
jgi:hypothetical protein